MKKLETSQIIENVLSNGVITEREVLLLKKRANNGDNEAANFYPGCDIEIEVTEEQSAKGYKWLMNLYKTPTGKERKNNPFGYREMNILDNYKDERFQFVGFYNNGNRRRDYYIPIYSLCGMKYYANSEGSIQIVG